MFYAIESIGLGTNKPSRIILWLNDKDKCLNPPESLERLKSRGLEIKYSENYGPHTKYYPYIQNELDSQKPLVTADDDNIYPKDWLKRMLEAYKAKPSVIHCYRTRRISLNNMKFLPYNEWDYCSGNTPSHENFITGVSGAIYPQEFLNYLKKQGDIFKKFSIKNDDIWLTLNALRSGFKIAQISNRPLDLSKIPGSQKKRLMDYNVGLGGNQVQLIQTFTKEDLEKLDSYMNSEE